MAAMPTRDQTRTNYDRLSRWYDLLAGSSERWFRDAALRMLDPRAGETILEIGFGTGHALAALGSAVGREGLACGIDLSPGMCRVALGRLRQAGPAKRAIAACGDATRLPLPAGHYDGVLMSFSLELFDANDMSAALTECRRVLRAEGRLCVAAMSEAERATWMTRLYGWSHRRFPSVMDCHSIPVEHVLYEAGYRVIAASHGWMWGLPVSVVLAGKAPERQSSNARLQRRAV